MKPPINALIFGAAIVIASLFLGKAYKDRTKVDGQIQVTGLGKTDFVSDLIVWGGYFQVEDNDLKNAYASLEKNNKIIKDYLLSKGVAEEAIVFGAANTNRMTRTKYSPNGNYMGDEFIGYRLTKNVQIESNEVKKIETISREITELLNKGVNLYSESPRYYYTKLSDLKLDLISRATEDARIRAENIAQYSGGKLDELQSAKMGVFQITGQNSKEDYSWGGTFNTSAKKKTASITMKLNYKVN